MNPRLVLPLLAMFLILWANSGVATQSTTPPINTDKLINLQEFKEALPTRAEELGVSGLQGLQKAGNVVIIDVRDKESFERRHLAGSVNAPLTGLTEKTLPEIAPDKEAPVVLVCDYTFFPVRMLAMTLQAYPVLKANGYKNIYRLNLWSGEGGIQSQEEQEKVFAFEGTELTPQKPQ